MSLLYARVGVRTPNTPSIHLEKDEFKPLDYLTKKRIYLSFMLLIRFNSLMGWFENLEGQKNASLKKIIEKKEKFEVWPRVFTSKSIQNKTVN